MARKPSPRTIRRELPRRVAAHYLLFCTLDVQKQKEFCNTTTSEVTRLGRLIGDLLSVSSMEVGSLTLERLETDVERLLREAVEKVRPQMDHGGIAFETAFPEKLPKVFHKFFRSPDLRVRDQPGTGLGLSLAREVIRLHGGTLTAESELDKGSKFTVTLPIA